MIYDEILNIGDVSMSPSPPKILEGPYPAAQPKSPPMLNGDENVH